MFVTGSRACVLTVRRTQSRGIFSQIKELYAEWENVQKLTSEEHFNALVAKRKQEEDNLRKVP